MSTNYYAFGPFPSGEPDGKGLHIGQHMGGLEFLWRAHPDRDLTSTDAWRTFLDREGVTIQSEWATVEPFNEFWKDATLRPAQVPRYTMGIRAGSIVRWRDTRGCPFSDVDFF